jgi:hypothetical protein
VRRSVPRARGMLLLMLLPSSAGHTLVITAWLCSAMTLSVTCQCCDTPFPPAVLAQSAGSQPGRRIARAAADYGFPGDWASEAGNRRNGIRQRKLYLVSVDPMRNGLSGSQAAEYFPKLLDRIQALPFVVLASLGSSLSRPTISADTIPIRQAVRFNRFFPKHHICQHPS